MSKHAAHCTPASPIFSANVPSTDVTITTMIPSGMTRLRRRLWGVFRISVNKRVITGTKHPVPTEIKPPGTPSSNSQVLVKDSPTQPVCVLADPKHDASDPSRDADNADIHMDLFFSNFGDKSKPLVTKFQVVPRSLGSSAPDITGFRIYSQQDDSWAKQTNKAIPDGSSSNQEDPEGKAWEEVCAEVLWAAVVRSPHQVSSAVNAAISELRGTFPSLAPSPVPFHVLRVAYVRAIEHGFPRKRVESDILHMIRQMRQSLCDLCHQRHVKAVEDAAGKRAETVGQNEHKAERGKPSPDSEDGLPDIDLSDGAPGATKKEFWLD